MEQSHAGVPGTPSEPVLTATDDVARETYRHLRLMLVALPGLIVVAIVLLFFAGTLEGSISAYYAQPIRDVFVGAMVGTAVCLVVYRGRPPFEDYALNVAGFYAICVAFIPTGFAENLATLEPDERGQALFGLRASLISLVLVTAAFVYAEWRFGHWTVPSLLRRPATKWPFVLVNVVGLGFLLLVVVRGFLADEFAGVHGTAAVLLFVSLALAVATHAWPGPFGGEGSGVKAYQGIVGLMVLGLPLAGVLALMGSEQTVLILEVWEIALFTVFWALEAIRTWHAVPGGHGTA